MTKTYHLQDGGTITATCASDFVSQLRQSSLFDSNCSDQDYMYHLADRFHDQTGIVVRADSPDNFLSDLLQAGFISEID